MIQKTDVLKPKSIFPFAQITTILFILILFLLPFIFLSRLLLGQLYGNISNELEVAVGTLTVLQGDLIRIVPVSILALWSFLRGPVLLIRRRKMEPLEVKYPKLTDQILRWETVSRLKQKPILLRLPDDNPTIFAFGTWRYHYIAISDGALELWPEPDLFEAVFLHEIGHIANGDTWKASFALEYVNWYFILLISEFGSNTLPFLLGLSRNGGVVYGIIFPLEGILEGLFFIIAVRYLFRLREFGADYFAWTNLGGTNSLQDAIYKTFNWAKTGPQQLAFMSESLGNRWTRLLGFHPSTSKRLSLMLDPKELMDDVVGLAMVAGITLGLIPHGWRKYRPCQP